MLMPSIFGEDLFEDLFDLPFYDDSKVEKKLYGRHAKNLDSRKMRLRYR